MERKSVRKKHKIDSQQEVHASVRKKICYAWYTECLGYVHNFYIGLTIPQNMLYPRDSLNYILSYTGCFTHTGIQALIARGSLYKPMKS